MGLQVNVRELITQLYNHRSTVEYLFGNRDTITVNELLATGDITEEQYRKLIQQEILYEYHTVVGLNDSVIAMLEDFMEIGEVTPGVIRDYISELNRNLEFYNDVKELRFLRAIKKYLKRIGIAITREIIKLQKNIDDTYKNEGNYRIKLQKLEDYRTKRDAIIDFIKKTEELLNTSKNTFSISADSELYGIVSSLKSSLIENLDYLIEIQTDITDYINKIQFQLDVYKKAQKIKDIKDRGELHYRTNFKNVVEALDPIGFNSIRSPRTKVSVEFLFTDEGHIICKRVAEKYKISRLLARRMAEKLPGDFKDLRAEAFVKMDTAKLVEKFMSQKKNLFEFLQDYKFPKVLGDLSFEERITLFVEVAMEYEKHLDFRFTLNYFDYEVNGQKKKLGYTLILPNRKKSENKEKSKTK
ncbi:MAG: hypothetical protein ACK452_04695 [Bacteroidota bacterium]